MAFGVIDVTSFTVLTVRQGMYLKSWCAALALVLGISPMLQAQTPADFETFFQKELEDSLIVDEVDSFANGEYYLHPTFEQFMVWDYDQDGYQDIIVKEYHGDLLSAYLYDGSTQEFSTDPDTVVDLPYQATTRMTKFDLLGGSSLDLVIGSDHDLIVVEPSGSTFVLKIGLPTYRTFAVNNQLVLVGTDGRTFSVVAKSSQGKPELVQRYTLPASRLGHYEILSVSDFPSPNKMLVTAVEKDFFGPEITRNIRIFCLHSSSAKALDVTNKYPDFRDGLEAPVRVEPIIVGGMLVLVALDMNQVTGDTEIVSFAFDSSGKLNFSDSVALTDIDGVVSYSWAVGSQGGSPDILYGVLDESNIEIDWKLYGVSSTGQLGNPVIPSTQTVFGSPLLSSLHDGDGGVADDQQKKKPGQKKFDPAPGATNDPVFGKLCDALAVLTGLGDTAWTGGTPTPPFLAEDLPCLQSLKSLMEKMNDKVKSKGKIYVDPKVRSPRIQRDNQGKLKGLALPKEFCDPAFVMKLCDKKSREYWAMIAMFLHESYHLCHGGERMGHPEAQREAIKLMKWMLDAWGRLTGGATPPTPWPPAEDNPPATDPPTPIPPNDPTDENGPIRLRKVAELWDMRSRPDCARLLRSLKRKIRSSSSMPDSSSVKSALKKFLKCLGKRLTGNSQNVGDPTAWTEDECYPGIQVAHQGIALKLGRKPPSEGNKARWKLVICFCGGSILGR